MDVVFKSFLPKRCKMAFTVSAGIIGCKTDCVPLEVENGPAVAGFFIPEIPGVEVNHYAISGKKSSLAEFVSKNAPVKCLLLFLTSRGVSIANKLVRSCCPEEEDINMAVGGAIVERTNSLLGSATAFCGPNVEAASVIINAYDRIEEITAKLEVFRESGLLKNKCFAYMFACIGRGYCFHEEHNVESEIFSKMYPKVPIIGVFGEGEIGVNYIPNVILENKKLKAGKFKTTKRFLHSYTTIFVLISIKM
ncbi:F-box only protein 22 like protein [Argiope bruennichi]|uniref:F-box only protein 22 like protein n=2 Tax=Argiope bruennichi TaxID=94029 RepID=A0A8T0DZQ1_ARGBR|nr:F-box only protein 22 like protein [Argiope bruennichi]